jgi:hypothetical protein
LALASDQRTAAWISSIATFRKPLGLSAAAVTVQPGFPSHGPIEAV